MKPLHLALVICFLKKKQTSTVETYKTDTGVALYYYYVKTKDGRTRRMSSLANSLSQAEHFARLEAESYGGKIISKIKLEKKFEWQRSII